MGGDNLKRDRQKQKFSPGTKKILKVVKRQTITTLTALKPAG